MILFIYTIYLCIHLLFYMVHKKYLHKDSIVEIIYSQKKMKFLSSITTTEGLVVILK